MSVNSSSASPDHASGVRVLINAERALGLKAGEPALFRRADLRLLEQPTAFLRAHYVNSGRRSSPRTWKNAANAIANWIEFLDALGVEDWKEASRDNLLDYRESYGAAVSPKTGSVYASGTIALRMTTICALYAFAGRRNWYRGDILDEGTRTRKVPASSDLIPRRRRSRTAIRPFTTRELRNLLDKLGPRASDATGDPRASRDRLLADIGWSVGLRLDELSKLTKYQFLSLVPDPPERGTEHRLSLVGKGDKLRTVALPNWVLLDALAYIDGERAEAVKASKMRKPEPVRLFLSGKSSRRPGLPIGHRRIQQIIEEACRHAEITQMTARLDPHTREVRITPRPGHCVHDLRHTYAVFTYWAEKEHGNPEPWKKIQAQLGHEHLSTTVDTYLHFVEIFGESEGIDLRRLLEL